MSLLPERGTSPDSTVEATLPQGLTEIKDTITELPKESQPVAQSVIPPIIKPVIHDGNQIAGPMASTNPTIVIPMSEKRFFDVAVIKMPATEAVRWLRIFANRLRQMFPGRTVFKQT